MLLVTLMMMMMLVVVVVVAVAGQCIAIFSKVAVAVVRLSEKHPRTKTQIIPGPESSALLHMSPKAMKRKSQLNPKPLTQTTPRNIIVTNANTSTMAYCYHHCVKVPRFNRNPYLEVHGWL